MRHIPATQPPKETRRDRNNQNIQREMLRDAEVVLRIGRDVEIRCDVAKEASEGRAGVDDEERVAEGGRIDHLASFSGLREAAGTAY